MPNGIQVSCCSVRITDQKFITYIYKYWRFFFYPKLFPVLLLYYCIVYVNLFKDRSSWCPPFYRKAVAKVRSFSYILQIFAKLFSKFFFEARLRASLLKSGCKDKELFSSYQMFWEVFSKVFFEDLRGKELSAWASLMRKAGKSLAAKGQLHPKSPATACQASPLRFRKRVQKYSLFR